jgi:predicted component of type VI protein secretion system
MKLVIEDEAGTRSIVPFRDDAIVVGRGAEGVTFRLTDRNVSRRHARFLRQAGSVFVEDLGSLTGTRVNGERIVGRRRLRDGDLVQIGDYDLAILEEGVALDATPPPPLPPRAESTAQPARPPAAVEPTPAAPAPAPPPVPPVATRPGRSRVVKVAVATVLLAVAAGLAAAWAMGAVR